MICWSPVGGVSVFTRTHGVYHPEVTGEVTEEVTGEVERLVLALEGRMSRVQFGTRITSGPST
jgi:hypothetical protein